jgi:transcriptional regulator with XRE-family HTH domain
MKNINIQIGARIRARRKDLGMSQADLANAVGVTFQQIQKYENGTNALYATRLYQFTEILRVPICYFFGNAKEPEALIDKVASPHLSDKECMEIMKSFQKITHPTTRKRLADFIRSVAKS